MRRDAEPLQRDPVLLRPVSRVVIPAVAGMGERELGHQPVARHLGHDRGGGDREAPAVAFHHGVRRAAKRRRDVAVDQGGGWRRGQGCDRALHRQQGRAQDIEAVDFRHVSDADADLGIVLDRAEQRFPDRARQFLGVVEPAGERVGQPL